MKKLKISINSPAIPAGYNYTHIATSYQVATSYEFASDDIVFSSLNDSGNLTSITTTVDNNRYKELWVRTKYHYKGPSGNEDSQWSIPQEINDSKNKTDLYNSVVIHYTPIVKYTKDELGNINISTSEFNLLSGIGEHTSTSWKIKDKDEIPVYVRNDDPSNLTNIIPTVDLNDDNVYIVEASHVTYPTSSSNPGKDIVFPIRPNGTTFDFSLVSKFAAMSKFWHTLDLNVSGYQSYDVVIKDLEDNIVTSKYNSTNLTDYLNTNNCNNNTPYYYYVRVKFNTGYTSWVKYGPYVIVGNDNANNTYCDYFVEGPNTDIQYMSNINSYGMSVGLDEYFFFIKDNKVVTYLFTGKDVEYSRDVLDLTSYDIAPIPEASFINMGNGKVLIHVRLIDNSSLFLLCSIINGLTLELKIEDEYIFKDEINKLGVVNKYCILDKKVYFPFDVGYNTKYREGLHVVAITTLHDKLVTEFITLSSKDKWINTTLIAFNNSMYIINGGINVNVATNDVNYALGNYNVYLGNVIGGDRWTTTPKDNINVVTTIGTLPEETPMTLNDILGLSNSSGLMLLNNCHSGDSKHISNIINYNISTNNTTYIDLTNDRFHKVPFRNTIKLLNGDILRISSDVKGSGLRNQVSYILPTITSVYATGNRDITNPLSFTTTLNSNDYNNDRVKLLKPYHIVSDTNYIRPTVDNNITWRDDRETVSLDYTEIIATGNITRNDPTKNNVNKIPNMRGLNILGNSNVKLYPGTSIGDDNSAINRIN